MTTPIPEAAVEAVMDLACRIEVETEDWELGHKHFEWCDTHYPDCEPREGRESEKYTWSRGEKPLCPVAREIVEAALTAARPLMEAEIRRQVAAEIRACTGALARGTLSPSAERQANQGGEDSGP